jgi:hypothetical protein
MHCYALVSVSKEEMACLLDTREQVDVHSMTADRRK